jgi:hypothetical protein
MDSGNVTRDCAYYLRKETEYYAKAEATSDPQLKSAYEAAADEYARQGAAFKDRKL